MYSLENLSNTIWPDKFFLIEQVGKSPQKISEDKMVYFKFWILKNISRFPLGVHWLTDNGLKIYWEFKN